MARLQPLLPEGYFFDGLNAGTPADDINPIIDQYELRPGNRPYLSPVYVTTAVNGPFGVPYWVEGLPIQTCNMSIITAPDPGQKSAITHQAKLVYQAGQYGVGTAPTTGIYTGVEQECS